MIIILMITGDPDVLHYMYTNYRKYLTSVIGQSTGDPVVLHNT